MRDRRIEKRIPVRFQIGYIKEEDYLISYSKDISVDGMFLCMESPLVIGSKVKLLFSFEGKSEMEIDAEVKWVNRSGSPKDHGIGLKFINPSHVFKISILTLINRVAILYDEERT